MNSVAMLNTLQAYTLAHNYCQIDQKNIQSIDVSLVRAHLSDAPLLHQWMNLPHVAEYWQQPWSLAKIKRYLTQQIASYHEVFFILVNKTPIAYTEIYPVAKDPLSNYCQHTENDWGWHLLIGPKPFIGCGLSPAIGYTLMHFLFHQCQSNTIFCEPDKSNLRMINFAKRLLHRDHGVINIGTKVAQLMACHRDDFNQFTLPTLAYRPSLELTI